MSDGALRPVGVDTGSGRSELGTSVVDIRKEGGPGKMVDGLSAWGGSTVVKESKTC